MRLAVAIARVVRRRPRNKSRGEVKSMGEGPALRVGDTVDMVTKAAKKRLHIQGHFIRSAANSGH